MGFLDRLSRIARAEVSELKRVLREAEEEGDELSATEREQLERERLIAEAEAELARAEEDVLAAEIEAGAAAWATGPRGDADIARGAAMWTRGGDTTGEADVDHLRSEPSAPVRQARVGAFTREVREAYAALELPLGSDREAIERAYRDLLQRYHPDRHANAPHLEDAAHELTIRIRASRDLLLAWLEGA